MTWFNKHCRETDTGDKWKFAHSVFAVLDSQTAQDRTSCLLVSDAEEETVVETTRVHFSQAMPIAMAVGMNTVVLNEVTEDAALRTKYDT